MQLDGNQYSLLHQALLNVFPTADALKFKLRTIDRFFDQIVAPNSPYSIQAHQIIGDALANGWVMDLIRCVADVNPNDAALLQLQDALNVNLSAPPQDPYGVCYLWGSVGLPFVGREDLREAARLLAHPQDAAVLVVDGGPKSGKSYSYEFIAFLARQLNAYDVHAINLTKWPGTLLGPDDLARSVARFLDLDLQTMPQKDAQAARWALELSEWLVGKIRSLPRPLWIVIDGVNQVNLPPGTMEFIQQLVQRAGYVDRLRVVLLAYGEPVTSVNPRAKREEIPYVDKPALRRFFESLGQTRGKDLDDQIVSQQVEAILQRVANPPEVGLMPLPEAIKEAEQVLFNGVH